MTELMSAGVELMLIGMGIVFVFLILLIGAVNLMSAMVLRYFPEPTETQVLASTIIHPQDDRVIAAITSAVHRYRSEHK